MEALPAENPGQSLNVSDHNPGILPVHPIDSRIDFQGFSPLVPALSNVAPLNIGEP